MKTFFWSSRWIDWHEKIGAALQDLNNSSRCYKKATSKFVWSHCWRALRSRNKWTPINFFVAPNLWMLRQNRWRAPDSGPSNPGVRGHFFGLFHFSNFELLADELSDLSKAEKKITIVKVEKIYKTTIFTQNNNAWLGIKLTVIKNQINQFSH